MTRFVNVTIVSPGRTVEQSSARFHLRSNGGRVVLKRGQAVLLTGGSFYQLENTGPGPMIMMGNRSGPAENRQLIDYVTRTDIWRRQRA